MLIKALTIENFKGIREPVRIEFKPVTLLFGPNSAGKSTIIQALHYAHEIFERHNLDPGQTIPGGQSLDLGGFHNLVNNHDLSKSINIRFDLDLKNEDLPEYQPALKLDPAPEQFAPESISSNIKSAWVKITVSWSSVLEKPIIYAYEVGINEQEIARITSSKDGKQITLSYLNYEHPIFRGSENDKCNPAQLDLPFSLITLPNNDYPLGIIGQNSALPNWEQIIIIIQSETGDEKTTDSLKQFQKLITIIVVGPGEMVRDALRKFRYLGPLREVPPRNYQPARSPNQSRWAGGIAAWDRLHKGEKQLLQAVNSWLSHKDKLNAGYQVEVKKYKELDIEGTLMLAISQNQLLDEEALKEELENLPTKTRLFLKEEEKGVEVLPQDVGVGISQVLPVVVAALDSRNMLVGIEQPELHIHPAFQVALGDLFISQAKSDRDLSFLIETHSEHLLLRLLRRIRETSEDELPPGIEGLTPDELSIYYIENTEKGVKISELKVDQTGDSLGRWPDGFFEERHAELY